ncbi:Hypothetical_protein [Hexamita inflata]|uniref:Hypothetical_protein n=1 Tax=Hexamita inflata TaxID=28002 RepID=A0ABP1GWH8_9EUKA
MLNQVPNLLRLTEEAVQSSKLIEDASLSRLVYDYVFVLQSLNQLIVIIDEMKMKNQIEPWYYRQVNQLQLSEPFYYWTKYKLNGRYTLQQQNIGREYKMKRVSNSQSQE